MVRSATPPSAKLILSCPDRVGIVAAVAGLLAASGANIIASDQHSDPDDGIFFMRVEFAPSGPDSLERVRQEMATVAREFAMEWNLHAGHEILRTAILVSRADHCLYDLLHRYRSGELSTEVVVVIGNHEDNAPVAAMFGVPFRYLPITPGGEAEQELQIVATLEEAGIDLVVLARYMRILSPAFVNRYPMRIINVHHSLLPSFVGANPYRSAHKRGVKLIGATSHYVTEDLDEGPIIEQDVLRVNHRHSTRDLMRLGRDVERLVLARAVRAHLERRILVRKGRTLVFD